MNKVIKIKHITVNFMPSGIGNDARRVGFIVEGWVWFGSPPLGEIPITIELNDEEKSLWDQLNDRVAARLSKEMDE